MYEKFYGFREKPFSLLPDAEFLYFSENHRSAYNVLEYSLTGQAGFTIITGEVGSGKTTLVQTFLKRVGGDTNIGLITNTPRSFDDLMKWVLLASSCRDDLFQDAAPEFMGRALPSAG